LSPRSPSHDGFKKCNSIAVGVCVRGLWDGQQHDNGSRRIAPLLLPNQGDVPAGVGALAAVAQHTLGRTHLHGRADVAVTARVDVGLQRKPHQLTAALLALALDRTQPQLVRGGRGQPAFQLLPARIDSYRRLSRPFPPPPALSNRHAPLPQDPPTGSHESFGQPGTSLQESRTLEKPSSLVFPLVDAFTLPKRRFLALPVRQEVAPPRS
jgi:hypothetical protein